MNLRHAPMVAVGPEAEATRRVVCVYPGGSEVSRPLGPWRHICACAACAASVKLARGETMTPPPPPPSLRLAGRNSSGIVGTPGEGEG